MLTFKWIKQIAAKKAVLISLIRLFGILDLLWFLCLLHPQLAIFLRFSKSGEQRLIVWYKQPILFLFWIIELLSSFIEEWVEKITIEEVCKIVFGIFQL